MSDNNEKIKQFFLRSLPLKKNGFSDSYINQINSYSDNELKREYSSLKSISERKESVAKMIIVVVYLSFIGGLYKVFVDFTSKISDYFGASEQTYVLVNGFLVLTSVILLIITLSIVFYFKRLSDKKKKYYYVELLMKERGLL